MFVSGFTIPPPLSAFNATNGRFWTEQVEVSSSNLSCFCGATTHRAARLLELVVQRRDAYSVRTGVHRLRLVHVCPPVVVPRHFARVFPLTLELAARALPGCLLVTSRP